MALLGMFGFDDAVAEQYASAFNPAPVTGLLGVGKAYNSGGSVAQTIALPTSTASGVIGFRHTYTGSGASGTLLTLNEGATNHITIGTTATGLITIARGATVVATSTSAIAPANVVTYYEVKFTIADTGGFCEVKLNGTSIVSFTGDTRNAGTTGLVNTYAINRGGNTGGFTVDDLYILDLTGAAPYNDYLGDVAVRTLLPTGNGDSSGWLGSDGNSTDNYLLVDEVDSTMTDYVGASVSGTLDLYAMADLPSGYDVLAVQERIYAQKSDAGTPPTVLPVAKGALGTVRTDTALAALSTTAQSLGADIRTTDPDGNALTVARVNAMQVGVKVL